MPETPPALYVVETLTAGAWLRAVVPRLLRDRTGAKLDVRYVDATRPGLALARIGASLVRAVLALLSFRLIDIRDERGLLMRLRAAYFDFNEVEARILASSAFKAVLDDPDTVGRMPQYLAKQIASFDIFSNMTVWRAMYLVQVCEHVRRLEGLGDVPVTLFLTGGAWVGQVVEYGRGYGVEVVPVRSRLPRGGRQLFRRVFGARSMLVRSVLERLRAEGVGSTVKVLTSKRPAIGTIAPAPRIAVEYYGHLNLDRPEQYSDAFFWQQSAIEARDVLFTFGIPGVPGALLDDAKLSEIRAHGMDAVALNQGSAASKGARVFYHTRRLPGPRVLPASLRSPRTEDGRWLRQQVLRYHAERDYWADLFDAEGARVYVTWFKYSANHCAISDAMQSLGGVTAIYQRALEEFPSPETATAADLVFSFSRDSADIEARSGSVIPYMVITGYLGDHRFPRLREIAREHVRAPLLRAGAERVLAFFDENSHADERWHTGHTLMRENYAFLLEKLLADEKLGMVFKPKIPRDLRQRLGPVADLLQRAEATGRCMVLSEGPLVGSTPPAVAALAADIAIHGHLCAATAGFESALAGVPTLLMDREGWRISRLYELGLGTVVFNDWPTMWSALEEHRRAPSGSPGLGQWGEMLGELDPFRDGRAAQRMGTYLLWVLDGLKAGLPRETVLADAAARYVAQWGDEYMVEVTPKPYESELAAFDRAAHRT